MSGSAYVEGIALWLDRLPGWDVARAAIRGEAEVPAASAPRPAPTLLAPTERRRAPDTVAIALEVAAKACAAAGRDPGSLASVFASTHGDLAISDYLCETLAATPTLLSPTRFHNSVHNAAAGYWTIGNACRAPSTALTAFAHTFASGLLEALMQVECERAPVLYVAYDIPARGPMATVTASRGLIGAALVLAPEPAAPGATRLDWRVAPGSFTTAVAGEPLASLAEGNPMASGMALFAALAREEPGVVALSLGRRLALALDLAAPSYNRAPPHEAGNAWRHATT